MQKLYAHKSAGGKGSKETGASQAHSHLSEAGEKHIDAKGPGGRSFH